MGTLGLTAYQRRKFRRVLHETTDARLYRRVLAILEVDRGTPVSRVARLLNVSCQSIYNWIDRFQSQEDVATLANRYGVGRPTLWTELRRAFLRTWLESNPQTWGFFAVDWTVPLLQELLARYTGQTFSEDTVRRELRRQGYTWKRSRYVLAPDPELEKKTANSQNRGEFAASERAVGGRRNRPAAVSPLAGRVVLARSAPRGPD